MKRIIIDTETTGFNPPAAGIVEVAAVVLDDGTLTTAFTEICNPGLSALSGSGVDTALSISGIKRSEISAAKPSADVAKRLREWIRLNALGAPIHAFNVDFDARFLNATPWSFPADRWSECVMLAASEVMGQAGALPQFSNGKYKWPKLSEAAKFFGVDQRNAHRALGDAQCAAAIYRNILDRREAKAFQTKTSETVPE